jgi:glycosyltransferase involved in cell wall biosynthesis
MNQERPLISVIVRTKDRPKLLKRALQSIAAQTYKPVEVILVNDGGCDLDIKEMEGILGDVFLNYIRLEKNTGRAHAGNIGIENAKGEYIGFLDDDDEFYPEHIEILYSYLKEKEAKVVYSDCEIIRLQYNIESDDYVVLSKEPFLSYDYDFSFLLFSNYIPLICILFERIFLNEIGNFDESFELYEDWDFFIRAGNVYEFKHIRKITAIYKKWDITEQITLSSLGQNSEKDRLYYRKIIDKHREKYSLDIFYRIYEFLNHISSKLLSSTIYSKKLQDEILQMESLLRDQEERIGMLEHENSRLSTFYSKKLQDEILHMESLRRDQEQRIRMLEHENARLSTTLSRIFSSRGWRLLSKYYGLKEFIFGTDSTPNIFENMRDLLKRTAKKFLPKETQIYLKQLLYQISKNSSRKNTVCLSKNEKPFISIVIPIYNHAAFLKQALESALSQNYENYEVVAIDDFSTEIEVKEMLTEFSSRSKLRIFYNDINTGISETLNRAIINSKGDYIAFLDCDDFLPEYAIRKAAEAIRQGSGKGYFFSDRINIDINGKETEKVSFINRKQDNYFRELMRGMFTDHLKVVRKDAFFEVGLFDKTYDSVQDYEFALRYAFKYPTAFNYMNDYLYYHRVYSDQMSCMKSDVQRKLVEDVKNKIREKIKIRDGNSNKKLSIIVLSFNKKEHTVRCINSIKETVNCNYEIILFDNGSSSETVDFLHKNYSNDNRVRMFFSPENLGCPKGRKKAISYTDGDYILTLDNDIIVIQGWIEDLIMRADEDQQIAGACCKVIFPDNKIQYNGGRAIINKGCVEFSLIDAWKNAHDIATMRKCDCDWIPGGATIYKRDIYEKVSICDEYENAYEDNDFSFNVKKLGYRLVNCPTARVIHNHVYYDKKSSITEKEYMDYRYNHESLKRSVIAFYKRHGLIIKDEYIYKIFGYNGIDEETVKRKFSEISMKNNFKEINKI